MQGEPPKNLIDYVNGFKRRLFTVCSLAKEQLGVAQTKMKMLHDRKAESRVFEPGDQVLALTPVVCSPFQAWYAGPFVVAEKLLDLNDVIEMPGCR